jgi:hypothetical protein
MLPVKILGSKAGRLTIAKTAPSRGSMATIGPSQYPERFF